MNSLELFIKRHNLNETEAMNDLQNNGVISDLCVNAADVASADCFKACRFLQEKINQRTP